MNLHPRLSPTVDRFLAASFLKPFFFSLTAFGGVYLLADFFDRFDDLARFGGFGAAGLAYFLLKLPLIISQIFPVACLAGILLGFAMLNRTGEVLAFQGLGISRLEMAAPVLVIAAMLSLFDFVFSETVVPIATREARYLYTVQIKKRQLKGMFANRNIWMRSRDGFISVDSYDPPHQMLHGVTVFHLGSDAGLRDVHHSERAHWNGHAWQTSAVQILRIDGSGAVDVETGNELQLEAQPKDFGLLKQDPEEFSLAELNHYIHGLRRKGLDPGGYLVDRDLKYAMPLSCLIMVALGIALSLDPMPRHANLGRSFAFGIGIGFSYWLVLGFTASFGRSGLIPAWVAAWLPNLIFGAFATSLFLFGEER